ncbi:hypothetical protein [Clostridium sp.]|uniref:hypothetical protein n=1 Tax=Clostridium sp. TaxID=1506 RepID=UPI00258EA885|nr:hypothetical protein [Clostridium sp.]MDF2506076.1 hypothetical protein [Clostridium sp.]
MKKLILILLISMLIFSGCANKSVSADNINVNDIDSLTIITLPSPPKEKTITKKEDIKKVMDVVNSIKKEKMKQDDTMGWILSIHTSGKEKHSITFSGGKVVIDNLSYKINNTDIDKVKNLYNKLDYKEESYIKPYEYKSK